MNELEITRLFVYPIKSTRGIEVSQAHVLERGLEHDRRFMLVDEGGHLITARKHPKLLTVTTTFSGDSLVVSAAGMGSIAVPLEPTGEEHRVRVWFDWMAGLEISQEANAWFSALLGGKPRLVWMPHHAERRMNPTFGTSRISFVDGNPLHLVNQASLDDLSARVGAAVAVERFRPNLVVRGVAPYAEDDWTHLRFPDLEFVTHEPCARCMVINLEPSSGELGLEPLRTLAGYRRHGKAVLFGHHLHSTQEGKLTVGDRGTASTQSPLNATIHAPLEPPVSGAL